MTTDGTYTLVLVKVINIVGSFACCFAICINEKKYLTRSLAISASFIAFGEK